MIEPESRKDGNDVAKRPMQILIQPSKINASSSGFELSVEGRNLEMTMMCNRYIHPIHSWSKEQLLTVLVSVNITDAILQAK